jgi:hypothetical protein
MALQRFLPSRTTFVQHATPRQLAVLGFHQRKIHYVMVEGIAQMLEDVIDEYRSRAS